jgi:phosphorylated CTD-interacting factor 1
LRFKLIVAAEDHGFCDGASHQRKDPYRESPYDTAVFVLQTEAGAKKWPVTSAASGGGLSLKEALLVSFAQGRPTAAAKKRQKR